MDLRHVSDRPESPNLFCTLIATQVSSRELAGKKLQGYQKRDITYEVHVAIWPNSSLLTNMQKNLSHEDVKKVS